MEIIEGLKTLSLSSPLVKPAQNFNFKCKGRGTLFIMEVAPNCKAYRYDVNITAIGKSREGVFFEKNLAKGSDEGLRSRNRNLCYELLAVAYGKTNAFGAPESEIVYDCKSTLYCSKEFALPDRNIDVENAEVNNFIRTYCGANVDFRVSITPNSSGHVLDVADISQYRTGDSILQEDRSVRTFLEMAVTQFALNSNSYTPIGAGKLFETENGKNVENVGNGMVLRPGIAKGVRIVQNYGNPCPALIIDAKVCLFFAHQDLVETVTSICRGEPRNNHDWDRIRNVLQDVRVELKHSRNRTFGIQSMSKDSSANTKIYVNGKEISLVEYYRIAYDYNLKYPHFRAVVPNFKVEAGESPEYFPIELCVVMPDQRVPLEKMDMTLSSKLLSRNSVLPHIRLNDIMNHAKRLCLFENNPVLKTFGIRVVPGSNEVDIGVRHNPRIVFADQRTITPDPRQVEWKHASNGLRFLDTTEVSKWVVLCALEHEADARAFAQMFRAGCHRRGMVFSSEPIFPPFTGENWEDLFVKCVDRDVQFVMLIDPLMMDTHGILKYYEARYKVLTQHVTYERVVDVIRDRRKAQTLENILNKTNCKTFGINYMPIFEPSAERFAPENNKVLILGYDVANPPPMTTMERRMVQAVRLDLQSFDPSVIGITANMGCNPHNFVGDYFYQDARRDVLDLQQLARRVKWVLDTLERNRPAASAPPYIFVLRNGLSEGQFALSVGKEMQALREGCRLYRQDYAPKFVYVVGTKNHFKKFFVEQGDRVENLVPGSVISTKFVREDCLELFMMSHYPLKGTGMPVEYNVLVDEIGVSQDELQGLLNSLCFTHQIVNSAVSLPEPIFQADELAKRGRNNYIVMKRLDEHLIPRKPEHNLVDSEALTQMLSYINSPLNSTRFTA